MTHKEKEIIMGKEREGSKTTLPPLQFFGDTLAMQALFSPLIVPETGFSSRASSPSVPETTLTPRTEITATEALLAGILEQLKFRNAIELLKLEMKTEKESAELEAAKKEKKEDDERFAVLKETMYI